MGGACWQLATRLFPRLSSSLASPLLTSPLRSSPLLSTRLLLPPLPRLPRSSELPDPHWSLFDAVDAGWLPSNFSSPALAPDCASSDTFIGDLLLCVILAVLSALLTCVASVAVLYLAPCSTNRVAPCCAACCLAFLRGSRHKARREARLRMRAKLLEVERQAG